MSMNIFMLCHSATHAPVFKKAEKVISIHNRFTVTIAKYIHLKLVIKIINTIPGDQVCKHIAI